MKKRFPNSYHQGFTLIELVITISIIGIIAAMAAPNMSGQINQAKIKDGANILEVALKDARTQALISQRATRLVLTNTSTSKRATVYFVKRNSGDADEQLSEYDLNTNLTITSNPTSLTAVSFTPTKHAFQGESASGTLMNDTTNIAICNGAGLDKYVVKIDANSNIINTKDGTC